MRKESATQMELMLRSAKERLYAMDVAEIQRNSGIRIEEDAMVIESMGQEYRLSLDKLDFDRALEMWHHLTLLQYLFTADGTPLRHRWIALPDMPGGLSRGYGFDKDIALMFERSFNDMTSEEFKRLACRIGSVESGHRADASIVVQYAPRFPILVNFWESDDEFPCSGKVFVDANAHHYIAIEAAGGACSAVIQRLIELKKDETSGCESGT